MSIQDRFDKHVPPHGMQRVGSLVLIGLIVLLVVVLASGSWYTVDQGERGVVLRNGAVVSEAEPGLGFKVPLFETVERISIQSQNARFSDVKTYSRDQQPATLRVSLNFHVTDARTVYTDYKSVQNMIDRLVTPQVYTWSENVFGQFNAASAVQDRAKLNTELAIALRKVIRGPMTIESVQIENIDFSGKYEEAVEARMEATVRQQQAEAEAAATRTRADANAYSVKAQGEAEASAIRARGDALRENPGIPALVTAEKWDGHLPQTMVPGSSVPFINVKPGG
jgi:regulator of protease activity HflC (stomatin/prohibitin superfamily)